MNLLLEGNDLEALLLRAHREGGAAARIVRAQKVRRGGFLGFFAKEGFEVAVEIPKAASEAVPMAAITAPPPVAAIESGSRAEVAEPTAEQTADQTAERVGVAERAAAAAISRQIAYDAALQAREAAASTRASTGFPAGASTRASAAAELPPGASPAERLVAKLVPSRRVPARTEIEAAEPGPGRAVASAEPAEKSDLAEALVIQAMLTEPPSAEPLTGTVVVHPARFRPIEFPQVQFPENRSWPRGAVLNQVDSGSDRAALNEPALRTDLSGVTDPFVVGDQPIADEPSRPSPDAGLWFNTAAATPASSAVPVSSHPASVAAPAPEPQEPSPAEPDALVEPDALAEPPFTEVHDIRSGRHQAAGPSDAEPEPIAEVMAEPMAEPIVETRTEPIAEPVAEFEVAEPDRPTVTEPADVRPPAPSFRSTVEPGIQIMSSSMELSTSGGAWTPSGTTSMSASAEYTEYAEPANLPPVNPLTANSVARATTIVPRSRSRRAGHRAVPLQRQAGHGESDAPVTDPNRPDRSGPDAGPAPSPLDDGRTSESAWRLLRHWRPGRRTADENDLMSDVGRSISPGLTEAEHWSHLSEPVTPVQPVESVPDPYAGHLTPDPASAYPASAYDESADNAQSIDAAVVEAMNRTGPADAYAASDPHHPPTESVPAPVHTPEPVRSRPRAAGRALSDDAALAVAGSLAGPRLSAAELFGPWTTTGSLDPSEASAFSDTPFSDAATSFSDAAVLGFVPAGADPIAGLDQLAADQEALRSLGVPAAWTEQLAAGDRFGSIVAMLERLPEPRIREDAAVIAVVGPADVVELEAHRTALDLPASGRPRAVTLVPGAVGVDRRAAVARSKRIRPVVISVPIDGYDDPEGTRKILASIKAEAVIVVVDSTRPLAEITRWVQALEQVDAIALDGGLDSGTPAAALNLDVPVIRVDGIAVDRIGWAALLCAQLSAIDASR